MNQSTKLVGAPQSFRIWLQGWLTKRRQRRSLIKGSVRAVDVVVRHELGENALELTSVEDEDPIQAFPSNGADEALGDSVCPGCAHRCADDPHALGAEGLVEAGGELGVTITDEIPSGNQAFSEAPSELPSLLCYPQIVRAGCHSSELNSSPVEMDEKQYIEPAEGHGLDREEVAGEHGRCVDSQKLTPGWPCSSRGWIDPVTLQDLPNARWGQSNPELCQLTVDPAVSPCRILTREPNDERHRARRHCRSTRASGIGPPASDEVAMPSKQRLRLDEEAAPVSSRNQTSQTGEKCTIGWTQRRTCDLATEDCNLVPEYDDFDCQIGRIRLLKS